MIKNLQHCIRVQEIRVAQRKRGYSKAVRRYLAKHFGHDRKLYNEWLATLPVTWAMTKAQKEAARKKEQDAEQWQAHLRQLVKHHTGVLI